MYMDNVKIIGCTNRKDILDSAILRPGRLDRLIKVPLPDENARKDILQIHTKNMSLLSVDMGDVVKLLEGMSGAEIKAVATEAGYCAIRDNRTKVKESDFSEAVEKLRAEDDEGKKSYLSMFG